MRFLTAFAVILLSVGFTNAQVKVEGPSEGTVGYRVKAKLILDVDDPKVLCVPANDDWLAGQDFAGNKYIDFVPGRKLTTQTTFTFIVAGNKAGKTYIETWVVVVKPDGPPAPPPEPEIIKTELYKSLLAAYKVSPSATAKANLLKVYTAFHGDVDAGKFSTFKEAHDTLKAVTPKFVGTDLQGVRDAVADYFGSQVGNKGSVYDKDKLSAAVAKVIAALTAIPD